MKQDGRRHSFLFINRTKQQKPRKEVKRRAFPTMDEFKAGIARATTRAALRATVEAEKELEENII